MDTYDPVTPEQNAAIKAKVLKTLYDGYVLRGYSPERIRTLMLRDEMRVMEDLAAMQAAYPYWLTPRRQRILQEIR